MNTINSEPSWDAYVARQQRTARPYRTVEAGKVPARGAASAIDAELYALGHRRMGGINCELDRLWLQGVGTSVHLRPTLAKDYFYARHVLARAKHRGMTVRAWIDADLSTVVEWVVVLPCPDTITSQLPVPALGETAYVPKDTFTSAPKRVNGPHLLFAESQFWKARLPMVREHAYFTLGVTEDTLTISRTK